MKRPIAISDEPLRIGLVSGPMVRIPPAGYAGTERIVAVLVEELVRRGHDVALIGPGDSQVPCRLIPTIDRALWSSGMRGTSTPYIQVSIEKAWAVADQFDVVHSHLDTLSFALARHCPTPVVHTLHGRLDLPGVPELLDEFREIPLVAISRSQRRWRPRNNWVATVHHGLPLDDAPFSPDPGSYLAFVGRGFLVDDLHEAQLAVKEAARLDRRRIRENAIERFGVDRMVDEYETVYRRLAGRPAKRAATNVGLAEPVA